MSATIATKDQNAKVAIRTVHGALHLSADQAANQHIPSVEVVRSFSPATLGSWSTYSQWMLDPNSCPDHVDRITLVLQLAAATKTGGTYIYNSADASFMSKSIEVRIGAELIWTGYPEATFVNELLHNTNEQKAKLLPAAGQASIATRKTNTAAGQTLYIDIPIPFILKEGWFTKSQAAPLDVKVFHADLTSIVFTDGSAPVMPITAASLLVSGHSFQAQASLGALVANQRKLGSVDTRYLDVVQTSQALLSGATTAVVNLQAFSGLFDHIVFHIRAQSSISTVNGNTQDAFLPITSYNVKDAGGGLIVPEMPSAYLLGPYLSRYVTGDATDVSSGLGLTQRNVYGVFFGSAPEDAMRRGHGHGFYKFSTMEKLNLTFPTLAANSVIDVIGYQWANLSANASGILKKTMVSA